MRTLTDVLAPGSAPLPEGLRTLQVSPSRFVEPGQTVHANFTFRNLGGGTATGFRVRFRLPEGLTYLVGTARVDDTPLDEQGGLTTLLQGSGADIGEVPPGGERRISLAYTVAPTIENGTPITLQAAIASFEVPVIGSNVVRLIVRSKPLLRTAKTKLFVAPVREAIPGEELQIRAHVHNAGESSAHDVMVLLPVPANTTYVERSARIDGRERDGLSDVEPFGVGRPTVVVPTLAPGATVEVGYRARIDAVLEDKTPIVATAAVCSQELAEFALDPVTLKVPSAPSFAGDETAFHAECDDEVVPGQRVRLAVRVRNVGTARGHKVRVKLLLPEGMAYCAGSRTVDGAPAADRDEAGIFVLGELEPGRSVELALTGVVRAPLANGTELVLAARVEWQKGHRDFQRAVTVHSAPAFPAAFNQIQRENPRRLAPADPATFTIAIANYGTDVANDVRVQLDPDRGLENLRVFVDDAESALGDDGTIHLDALQPGAPRTVRVEAKLAAALEDQSQLRLRATLRTAQLAPIDLGAATHVVASRPRFSAESSQISLETNEVLRPNRTTACRLTLRNEGTDRGRDVRVRLQLPDELLFDRVEGASRDGQAIVVGEIPAGETREATIFLRLVGAVGHNETLEAGVRVTGANVVPFSLEPLKLQTHAESSFAEGASLTSTPAEAVDAGAAVAYTLALRNCGDGAAKRLNVRFDPPSNSVYAPGSTTVNDVALLDFAGTSPLLSASGLTLGDVGVGVEILVRMQAIVNTPLPAGATIETRAYVSWDEHPETTVRAEPLRVRAAAALPIVEASLPFSVLDAAAAPTRPAALELPPAVPVNGAVTSAVVLNGAATPTLPAIEQPQLPPPPVPVVYDPTIVSLHLTPEKLAWAVRYLDEGTVGGLTPHLMVLRALFPEDASGADGAVRLRLRQHSERFNELVDRLFLKLRLPDAPVTGEDLESRGFRDSLRDVVGALRSLPTPAPYEASGLRLVGSVRADELAAADAALAEAPLVTAAPWLAMTLLLGATLERDGTVIGGIGGYREALRRQLASMRDLTPEAFVEAALFAPVDPELDDQRGNVIHTLAQHVEIEPRR